MSANLIAECSRVAVRARTLRIQDFRYEIEGDTVILHGRSASPEGADSVHKLFTATSARRVDNQVVYAPTDPQRPGAATSPNGYVQIRELGAGGGRLAESTAWEVRDGDTLQSIAQTLYGDPAAAARILRANPSLAGARDHLTIGMRLKIPV